MDFIQSAILGIVEGITEFLPVSSTGHLILASRIMGIPQTEFAKSFEIIIQLGAILAVFLVSARTIFSNIKLWPKLIVAFLPAALFGVTLYKPIKNMLLGNDAVVVASLAIGGLALIILEKYLKNRPARTTDTAQTTYGQAISVGIAQVLSLVPGVSRSASTIFGGLLSGMDRETAVSFSFMLSVPTMIAATGYDLVKSGMSFTGNEYMLLGIGFAAAFVSALLAVTGFIRYVRSHSFTAFGVYRIAIAIIYGAIFLTR